MTHAAIMIPGLDRIGGAERQAMLLAKGLRRRGWRVTIVVLSGSGGAAVAELRDAGLRFLSLEMRKGLADPRGWIRFHQWLRRERPDVVHAHLPHAAWLARWSRLAAPVPVVVDTLHSSCTGTMGVRFGYRCSRWMTDHVTAVSNATAESHLAAGMVRRDRLSVLGNGIEMECWEPDARVRSSTRRDLGIQDEFLWLAVGRLEAVKGYATLLHAMASLPKTARLVVAGAGPLEFELVQMTAGLGLRQRVRFLGFRPNVEKLMQGADGFVLASRYEGLPMVLLEAGACGVPAVATDVPGTREVIVNGQTGWLAPAASADALAEAMAKMMRAPLEERRAMGERARRRIEAHFSMENVLDRWELLYAGLVARNCAERRIRPTAREILKRRSAPSA